MTEEPQAQFMGVRKESDTAEKRPHPFILWLLSIVQPLFLLMVVVVCLFKSTVTLRSQ